MTTELLLANHDVRRLVLRYAPESGPIAEVSRHLLESEPDRGFYRPVGKRIAGVYASREGPIFFYDEHQFPLTKDVKLSVEPTGDDATFILEVGDKERLRIRYTAPPGGFDAWSEDPEMTDFFVWLAANFPSDRFIKFYTAEPNPVDTK